MRNMITILGIGIAMSVGMASGAAAFTGSAAAQEQVGAAPTVWRAAMPAAPFASRRWRETIAPFAHVRFCQSHPDECVRKRVSIRKRSVLMTPARMAELASVQRQVNAAIRPSSNHEGPLGDTWTIAPAAGDCDDYAVTKRARLLARGWPSSALLLVHTKAKGQDHLVLMVRMKGGDVILDNLSAGLRISPLERTSVVQIQSPVDPTVWLKPVLDLRIASNGEADPPA
jgi:predicted transglutaminase-like cysteine proteinase